MNRTRIAVLPLCLLSALPCVSGQAETPDFGFDGPEIYRIEEGIGLARIADINGDGSNDVIVVNNRSATLEILLQGRPDAEEYRFRPGDANFLANDTRLGRTTVPTEKRVTDLAVGDIDGDGQADLVYYGEPQELVVVYGGSDTRDRTARLRIRDGLLRPGALAVADWTGDGRDDVILLGESCLHLCSQSEESGLRPVRRILIALPAVGLEHADFDGDGREDLLLITEAEEPHLRIRYGLPEGGLGPEVAFDLPLPRSLAPAPWRIDGQLGLLAVQQKSGRLQVLRLDGHGNRGLGFGNPSYHAASADAWAKPVAFAVGDLTGNGRPDIVVARPNESLIVVYPGSGGGVGEGVASPSYAGITHAVAADLDGDGADELYVLSPEEKRVGRVEVDAEGAAAVPRSVDLDGDPVALGMLPGGAAGEDRGLAVVVVKSGVHAVILMGSDGVAGSVALPPMKSDPERVLAADLDRDGLLDLVLWTPYQGLVFLRQTEDGGAWEIMDAGEQGRKASRSDFSVGRPDSAGLPALLWTERNFVRAVRLRPSGALWAVEIIEQANAPSGSARVAAAFLGDLDGDGVAEAVLYDAQARALLLLGRGEGNRWDSLGDIQVGGIAPEWIAAVDIAGDGALDLVLAGPRRVVTVPGGARRREWVEVSSYTSPLESPRLLDMATGDLNGDGHPDIAVCETAQQHLEIVAIDADGKLHPGTRFRVFEERRFRRARGENPFEPREVAIGDLNADGLDDLLIVVHDRLIVYPQQPPP